MATSKTHRSVTGSTDQKLPTPVQTTEVKIKDDRKASSSFVQVVPKPKQLIISTEVDSKHLRASHQNDMKLHLSTGP
jgi:hypothetical protein